MTAKRQWTFEDLKALWTEPEDGPPCNNPDCPNPSRVHIFVESVAITNLIVASDLTPEIQDVISRGARWSVSR